MLPQMNKRNVFGVQVCINITFECPIQLITWYAIGIHVSNTLTISLVCHDLFQCRDNSIHTIVSFA